MLGPDFFNNASALLPILLLTKVADRARRQTTGNVVSPMTLHRLFIVVALIGEVGALVGASMEDTRGWMIWLLWAALLFCGALFACELLRADAGVG
ncbi:hypothetical protein GCM10027601_20870 [Nocardioides ungokensis]